MSKQSKELMKPKILENRQLGLRFHYWEGVKKVERVYMASEITKQLGYKCTYGVLRNYELEEGVDMITVSKKNYPEFFKSLSDFKSLGLRASNLILMYESGINKLLLKSKKPIGIYTRNWLAREVMPSIMHSGQYCIEMSATNPMSALFQHTEPSVQIKNSLNVNGLIYANNGDFRTYHNTVHKLVNGMTANEIKTFFNSSESARAILRKHVPENAMTESLIDEMYVTYKLSLDKIKESNVAETAPPLFRSLYSAGIYPVTN